MWVGTSMWFLLYTSLIVCFIPCNQNPEDRIGVCICICSMMFSLSSVMLLESPFIFLKVKFFMWPSVAILQIIPFTGYHLSSIKAVRVCTGHCLEALLSSSSACTPASQWWELQSRASASQWPVELCVSLWAVCTPFSSVHGVRVAFFTSNRTK